MAVKRARYIGSTDVSATHAFHTQQQQLLLIFMLIVIVIIIVETIDKRITVMYIADFARIYTTVVTTIAVRLARGTYTLFKILFI